MTVVSAVEDTSSDRGGDSLGGVAWSTTRRSSMLRAADRMLADRSACSDRARCTHHGEGLIDVAGFPCAGESDRHRDRRPTEDDGRRALTARARP
jgi:hypothetical protein